MTELGNQINPEVTKVVIDTDPGVDDAVALLLLLAAEKTFYNQLEIVGVTCSYGNTDIDGVVQNVLKTLTIANRTDVSIILIC